MGALKIAVEYFYCSWFSRFNECENGPRSGIWVESYNDIFKRLHFARLFLNQNCTFLLSSRGNFCLFGHKREEKRWININVLCCIFTPCFLGKILWWMLDIKLQGKVKWRKYECNEAFGYIYLYGMRFKSSVYFKIRLCDGWVFMANHCSNFGTSVTGSMKVRLRLRRSSLLKFIPHTPLWPSAFGLVFGKRAPGTAPCPICGM